MQVFICIVKCFSRFSNAMPPGKPAAKSASTSANNTKTTSTLDAADHLSQQQEAVLYRCFSMFDTDEDGKLSVSDITNVMQIMGENC